MPRKTVQAKTKSKDSKESSGTGSGSNSSSKKKESKTAAAVQSPPEPTPEVSPDVSDVEVEEKKKSTPSRESVTEDFDELVAVIDQEINRLRESQGKTKGVKFLRSLNKRVKTLRGHTTRVMKQKHKTKRKNNTNSGFLKPVQISGEMAKFTGWNPDEPRSRVDVTKYICDYIKEHDLQNPSDRRQILADKKLTKLLGCDKAEEPLTYYRIQTYMKKHFNSEKAS
jgi:upstream activation factor subunit UAF30